MSPTSVLSIDQLRADFNGQVIAPGDETYDSARTVLIGGVDFRPAVIIRPASAAEVARVVTLSKETGLELAIRSGGHSGNAHSSVDDGVVLDLADMKSLDIDVAARTAWAGTGLTAGEVTAAVGQHGLAIGFGDTGSVGIGGISLGGGVGFLSRKYGLTVDNMLAAEIVTAAGEILTVDADNHPDLFWAIRGGGGNFGVVTRIKYQLSEVPQIVGGMLMLPATAETIAGAVAAAENAPEELSAIINVMNAPPMPFIPAEVHGQIILMILLCYAGPADEGETHVSAFRNLATPLVDGLQAMPYSGLFEGGPEGDNEYHPTAVGRTTFYDKLDLADAETIFQHITDSDAPMRAVQLRVLGGKIAAVDRDATAFAHRDERIMAVLVSFYDGPDDKPRREQWVHEIFADLDQGHAGSYVNFVNADHTDAVSASYPGATYQRLAAIKATYDPENLFRRNVNITPA
jgi:FAD/FMN-containing dehydrogenase